MATVQSCQHICLSMRQVFDNIYGGQLVSAIPGTISQLQLHLELFLHYYLNYSYNYLFTPAISQDVGATPISMLADNVYLQNYHTSAEAQASLLLSPMRSWRFTGVLIIVSCQRHLIYAPTVAAASYTTHSTSTFGNTTYYTPLLH